MTSVLDSIPGLGGYLGMRRQQQGEQMAQMQQLQALGGLLGQFQQQALQEQQAKRLQAEDARRAATEAEASNIYQQFLAPQTETVAAPAQEDPLTGLTVGGRPFEQKRAPDLRGFAMALMQRPELMPQGTSLLNAIEQRDTRTQAAQMQQQNRLQELQMRMQDAQLSREQRAQMAAEANQLRRDLAQQASADRFALAQFAASNRPERADPLVKVEVDDPTQPGKKRVEYRPQSQSAGMSPPGPGSTGKALPVNAAKALFDNNQNLRRAETALALIEGKNVGGMQGDPNATGWKGFLPDAALQRLDPSGIQTRAAIADLGSLVIHDRSGAAVTAAEFPRLKPFIPDAKDDPATIKKKLNNFVSVYRQTAQEMQDFWQGSGYNVPQAGPAPGAARPGASGEWSIKRKD